MANPSAVVRAGTYLRDGHRCVSCGSTALQYQHHQATGMGGSKTPPTIVDGITSCATCNPAYEAGLQMTALQYGWKVRGWVKNCTLVPVYYPMERQWFRLHPDGMRWPLSWDDAVEMMTVVYGPEFMEGVSL